MKVNSCGYLAMALENETARVWTKKCNEKWVVVCQKSLCEGDLVWEIAFNKLCD